MIRSYDIGTTTVQGPAHDMPVPFDPQAHNADRAQTAALGADPVPAARRSPLEHERDAGQVLDPASEVAWLRKIGINSAANLIEALVEECSREFARGYEVGRAVGAVEGKA